MTEMDDAQPELDEVFLRYPLRPGEVVLFGLEGQVDAFEFVPEPLPDRLLRALPPSDWSLLAHPVDRPVAPASYRRIGKITYQRET